MKYSTITSLLLLTPSALAASVPSSNEVSRRDPEHAIWMRSEITDANIFKREEAKFLEKRRGGGGGGGGRGSGGGSSSSSSSGGGGRGSGSSSSSSSGSSSGGSRGTSITSNAGGRSVGGSGKAPSIPSGGGRSVYSGGSSVPYTAGKRSPLGIAPFLLPLAFLSFWPGLWLASAYSYHWQNPIRYFNRTLNENQTLPVQCLCQEYSVCGCDENGNVTYAEALIALKQPNTTHIAEVNGTLTLFINGTLPNGTTAAGGTDSAASIMGSHAGWIWVVALVSYMSFML